MFEERYIYADQICLGFKVMNFLVSSFAFLLMLHAYIPFEAIETGLLQNSSTLLYRLSVYIIYNLVVYIIFPAALLKVVLIFGYKGGFHHVVGESAGKDSHSPLLSWVKVSNELIGMLIALSIYVTILSIAL